MQTLQFLAAPFVMCLLLAGIHCYLGLHVLARGVIFVDLSLAQVAALGATAAVAWGYEHHSWGAYWISLLCTFAAAAIFALSRKHEKVFSQEAVIGIVYALASGSVVVLLDRFAHGAEHLKDLMVGSVLWVTWSDVTKTATIYSGVALLHWIFRRQLIQASFGSEHHNGLWDFIFYALFGIVITSSVSMAGVLQVFAYLIVPAVLGRLFFRTLKAQLIFGWVLGFVLSFAALFLSTLWDLPSGSFIVIVFTSLPIIILLGKGIRGVN